jgi:hypothetical protein
MYVEGSQTEHVGITISKSTYLNVGQLGTEESFFSYYIVPCNSIRAGIPL